MAILRIEIMPQLLISGMSGKSGRTHLKDDSARPSKTAELIVYQVASARYMYIGLWKAQTSNYARSANDEYHQLFMAETYLRVTKVAQNWLVLDLLGFNKPVPRNFLHTAE